MQGLNLVLRRMLSTCRAARYRDAAEAAEAMECIMRGPDGEMCLAMLERRVVPALRALFLRHWAAKEETPWGDKDQQSRARPAVRGAGGRVQPRGDKLAGLEEGDSGSWDAAVLCTILLR